MTAPDTDHAGIIHTLTDTLRWNYTNPDSNTARMELVDGFDVIDDRADALAAELAAERAKVVLLQKTCWLAMQVNADVTTKREGEPGYYANVEALYAAVALCEKEGLLPPGDLPRKAR